jgi:Adenylate and Guanylate cyclase catalytic domain
LRRLATYRAVFEDFIARFDGRIFNTAGDAVLAEFSSSVEAVRCAIDVQESLRTRNLAYPASRQMSFRIGITVGDVVEREGDLLGDGVNIAARLEGIAQPGGLCVSRAVYEQVANKLSVEFTDIGEQQLKNIPTPIHAFTLALGTSAPVHALQSIDDTPGVATAKTVWKLRYPLLVAMGIGIYFAIISLIGRDVVDFIAAAGLTGVGYWFIYRNLNDDIPTAKIASLVCAGATGYFLLANVAAQNILFATLEAISGTCLLYVFIELSRLPRHGRRCPPRR